MRKLDVAADAGVGEPSGLHVPGIGEHALRELELGFGQRIGSEAGEIRRLIIADLEPVGIRVLQASDGGPGARVLDALVEPQRQEVAVLVERLGCRTLFLAGENFVRCRGQKIANLFRNHAVGGIERGQRIDWGGLLRHSDGLLRHSGGIGGKRWG